MLAKFTARRPRFAGHSGLAVVTAFAVAASLLAGLATARASAARAPVTNPYSPAYQHPYRHGVIPTLSRLRLMNRWAKAHGGDTAPMSPAGVHYGGGVDGIGVTTGHEKVYLVFYGSQWGSQSENRAFDLTLSGDPSGEAPYLQEFFKGLGTNNETWSGVATQYCEDIATGAQSCPSSSNSPAAYPFRGALAGVWADESAASPPDATGNQLAAEAVKAAAHFGNTNATANRNAQYVILSPTGTDPDNYMGNYCAWHDYNGDPTLSGGPVLSPYGDIAFTNMPYVTDEGTMCGQNFVNPGSAGTLDGVSIVEGHEYTETITDQNPPGGWTGALNSEIGDLCAWIPPGNPGGAADISLASGSFPVQSMWANDGNGGAGACEIGHPIITDPDASASGVSVRLTGEADLVAGGVLNSLQYYSATPGGSWTGNQVAGYGSSYSAPSVTVRSADSQVDIATEGPNDTLQYYWGTSGSSWYNAQVGGPSSTDSAPSLFVRAGGEADITAEAPLNALWFYSATPGGPWTGAQVAGPGTTYSPPSIYVRPNGEADIVAEGPNNTLQYYSESPGGTWSSDQVAGPGSTYSPPSIYVRPNGEADIVAEGPNNTLQYYWGTTGTTWSSTDVSGPSSTYSAPSIYVRANGEADIVAEGSIHSLQYYYATPGSSWKGAQVAGSGTTYSAPSIYVRANGEADIVAEGSNNTLQYYYATPGSSWTNSQAAGPGTTFLEGP